MGFDVLTTMTDEVRKPARSISKGVQYTLLICIGVYVLTAVSLCGMVPLQDENPDTALADAFSSIGLEFVSYIIYISAIVGILTTTFNCNTAMPKVLQA